MQQVDNEEQLPLSRVPNITAAAAQAECLLNKAVQVRCTSHQQRQGHLQPVHAASMHACRAHHSTCCSTWCCGRLRLRKKRLAINLPCHEAAGVKASGLQLSQRLLDAA